MADLALFLHPGVLFVGPSPREEHLMLVLFSSYGWYPKYWAVPESSGLPKISGNTQYFRLPATQWFPKLNWVGYRKKFRVVVRVRVPAGHCLPPPTLYYVTVTWGNLVYSRKREFWILLRCIVIVRLKKLYYLDPYSVPPLLSLSRLVFFTLPSFPQRCSLYSTF